MIREKRIMARRGSRNGTSSHQLTVIGLAAVLVLMITALLLCLVTFTKLKSRAQALEAELVRLEQLSRRQSAELENKGDPDYITKYARENLDLIEDGEEQFVAR